MSLNRQCKIQICLELGIIFCLNRIRTKVDALLEPGRKSRQCKKKVVLQLSS